MDLKNSSGSFYGTQGIFTGGGLTLSESTYPAGLRMPRHEHEPAYFSLVLKGVYTETSGKTSRQCVPSTMIVHPPRETHAVDFHDSDVRIFRVQVEPDWLNRTGVLGSLPSHATHFSDEFLSALWGRLYSEFHVNDESSRLAIEGLLLEIVAHISRAHARKNNRQPWLELAREILRDSISEPPSLATLARTVGVHPVYLARQFRHRYHCSIGEYVRRLRIEAVCRAMADAEIPLSMVSTNAGFYDQSHFANTFKRYTGMTPTQYRALANNAKQQPRH